METNSSLNSDNPSAAMKSIDLFNAEDRIAIVRDHYVRKGYRVHSGLQFGCELVLYADDPSRVHSDFCVHIVPYGMCVLYNGKESKSSKKNIPVCPSSYLVSCSFPLSLMYILQHINLFFTDGKMDMRTLQTLVRSMPDFHKRLIVASIVPCATDNSYEVKELSFSSQHAPFRQKAASHGVGKQRKPQNIDTGDESKSVKGNTP